MGGEQLRGLLWQDVEGKWDVVEPKDSNRVFVDIAAYNSKSYFIQGDVASPGKLPHTGYETVLDAMNYAVHHPLGRPEEHPADPPRSRREAGQDSRGRPGGDHRAR